jgi:serine/threonine-protein kinase RsbW
MARMEISNGASNLQTHLATRHGGRSLLEVDARIASEVQAISPLVERLMRLIEGSHCVTGEEHAVQLALREALNNAVVHGNRLDVRRLVHVRCRCKVGTGITLIVSDEGAGFDARGIPNPRAVESLEADHGRGIHIMKLAMDQVSFAQGGTEVRMYKRPARNARDDARSDSRDS